jgi:hypothetical protein
VFAQQPMSSPVSLKWPIPFRVVAAAVGLANVVAFFVYFSLDWQWIALTAMVTLALLWFAFFPRKLLRKYWLVATSLAVIGLAVIISEVQVALSVVHRADWFPVWGPLALAGLFIIMVVEAGVVRRSGNKHA